MHVPTQHAKASRQAHVCGKLLMGRSHATKGGGSSTVAVSPLGKGPKATCHRSLLLRIHVSWTIESAIL